MYDSLKYAKNSLFQIVYLGNHTFRNIVKTWFDHNFRRDEGIPHGRKHLNTMQLTCALLCWRYPGTRNSSSLRIGYFDR